MNLYFIKDRENNNFFVNHKKWTTKMYLAKNFNYLSAAKAVRSKIKCADNKKYDIVEYELIERRSL